MVVVDNGDRSTTVGFFVFILNRQHDNVSFGGINNTSIMGLCHLDPIQLCFYYFNADVMQKMDYKNNRGRVTKRWESILKRKVNQ